MAKHTQQASERSKVRIFFVEADLAPGDIHELTQALTTAIRPTQPVLRSNPARLSAATSPEIEIEAPLDVDAEPVEVETSGDVSTVRLGGPSKPRHYKKPKPVDMDMKAGGKPFAEFAAEKAPTTQRGKYMVAAAWLHDFARIEAITADHVYTCYKAAGWTFDVADPSFTLRQLASDGLGTAKRGVYSINHLGLAEVEKMKPASA